MLYGVVLRYSYLYYFFNLKDSPNNYIELKSSYSSYNHLHPPGQLNRVGN